MDPDRPHNWSDATGDRDPRLDTVAFDQAEAVLATARKDAADRAHDRVVVDVGSRIRISVELLREFYERPDHTTETVKVVRLVREADGTITVWLATAE